MFGDQQTFGLQQTHRLPQGVVLTPSWRASFTWDRIAPAGISPLSSISRRRVYTSAVLLTTGLGKTPIHLYRSHAANSTEQPLENEQPPSRCCLAPWNILTSSEISIEFCG